MTFAPGTEAPVASLTWPEILPAVCADNLADDNITKNNTKTQQAIGLLKRSRLSRDFRATVPQPRDLTLAWRLEGRKGILRRLPATSLTRYFNMVTSKLGCIERP